MDHGQKSKLRQKVTERLTGGTRSRKTPKSSIFKNKILVEGTLKLSSWRQLRPASAFIPRQTLLSCFLQLPPELQFKILSYLDLGEMQRLRQTCRLFRESIDNDLMMSLFPRLFETMLRTCYLCLTEKTANVMVLGSVAHNRFPMTSKCFDCLARRSLFEVGRLYSLASSETVFVCRWCGIPVTAQTGWHQPEFHIPCYQKYKVMLMAHYLVGIGQWLVMISGSALCWHYFGHQLMVTVPLVFAFIMSFWTVILNFLRGHAMRTYHWSMITEVIILALWIPPMYAIINKAVVHRATSSFDMSQTAITATLTFIAFNMMFRLLNSIGHLILLCEWRMWQRSRPGISRLRRVAGEMLMILVVFADPQSLQQEYPGRWWFKRQRL
ncbi:hypothetical protein V8C35DRAFT_309256 [Trichoderma chlorosporum]